VFGSEASSQDGHEKGEWQLHMVWQSSHAYVQQIAWAQITVQSRIMWSHRTPYNLITPKQCCQMLRRSQPINSVSSVRMHGT
jgi:hypothetical protein